MTPNKGQIRLKFVGFPSRTGVSKTSEYLAKRVFPTDMETRMTRQILDRLYLNAEPFPRHAPKNLFLTLGVDDFEDTRPLNEIRLDS